MFLNEIKFPIQDLVSRAQGDFSWNKMGMNLKFHLSPVHFISCEITWVLGSLTPNLGQNIYFVFELLSLVRHLHFKWTIFDTSIDTQVKGVTLYDFFIYFSFFFKRMSHGPCHMDLISTPMFPSPPSLSISYLFLNGSNCSFFKIFA